MTAKEAYSKVMTKISGIKITKCYEYDSVFTFHLEPYSFSNSKRTAPMLDGLICVDKTTGVVRDFKPYRLSIDEYRSGREIPAVVYKG